MQRVHMVIQHLAGVNSEEGHTPRMDNAGARTQTHDITGLRERVYVCVCRYKLTGE